MITAILTKHSGWILGPFATIFGIIMNAIYEFFNMFGIQNIALCIIVFTFITKTLMLPLTIKQQKFTKLSSKMNPEIQKIQAKYKGKKDEVSVRKQQEETNAVYAKYGANPMAGCLPLLITFPIIFALFRVINNIPAYVGDIKDLYNNIAIAIQGTEGYVDIIAGMAKDLNVNVKDFTEYASNNTLSTNHIIDIMAKFNTSHWNDLKESFPALKDTIASNSSQIIHANQLFGGLNIANNAGWKFPGIIIPILATVTQFIQGKTLNSNNPNKQKTEDPSMAAMNSMNNFMPLMSGFFCVMFPIGLGIYWIAGSVYAIIQQFFVNKYMDKIDVDELVKKNLAKANKKKSFTDSASGRTSVEQLAKTQTKNIVTDNESSSNNEPKKSYQPSNYNKENISKGTGSISDIANILKNNNGDKGGR